MKMRETGIGALGGVEMICLRRNRMKQSLSIGSGYYSVYYNENWERSVGGGKMGGGGEGGVDKPIERNHYKSE